MNPQGTQMYAEAGEAAAVARRQREANVQVIETTVARLRALAPRIIFTCARGSSDHAATFAKYLFETRLRIPTVSQAPSVISVYGEPPLDVRGAPFLVLSQSGKSPDLLMSAKAVKAAGAVVIALVNDTTSPLAELADIVIPLHAGPETSVAATKSYIAMLSAIASLVAVWASDAELQSALGTLDTVLATAWQADWSPAIEQLAPAQSMFVLGRGLTLAIAQEAALKFKETSGVHAEAFSLAEVAHGPMALVKRGFPLLVLPPNDAARLGVDALIAKFAERGATIAIAGQTLPMQAGLHPAIAPIAMAQSFYKLVNAIAVRRGYDPDRPPLLNKVTETQ